MSKRSGMKIVRSNANGRFLASAAGGRDPNVTEAVGKAFASSRPAIESVVQSAREVTLKRRGWMDSIGDRSLRKSAQEHEEVILVVKSRDGRLSERTVHQRETSPASAARPRAGRPMREMDSAGD